MVDKKELDDPSIEGTPSREKQPEPNRDEEDDYAFTDYTEYDAEVNGTPMPVNH